MKKYDESSITIRKKIREAERAFAEARTSMGKCYKFRGIKDPLLSGISCCRRAESMRAMHKLHKLYEQHISLEIERFRNNGSN